MRRDNGGTSERDHFKLSREWLDKVGVARLIGLRPSSVDRLKLVLKSHRKWSARLEGEVNRINAKLYPKNKKKGPEPE
jgi:hypothetical protein